MIGLICSVYINYCHQDRFLPFHPLLPNPFWIVSRLWYIPNQTEQHHVHRCTCIVQPNSWEAKSKITHVFKKKQWEHCHAQACMIWSCTATHRNRTTPGHTANFKHHYLIHFNNVACLSTRLPTHFLPFLSVINQSDYIALITLGAEESLRIFAEGWSNDKEFCENILSKSFFVEEFLNFINFKNSSTKEDFDKICFIVRHDRQSVYLDWPENWNNICDNFWRI